MVSLVRLLGPLGLFSTILGIGLGIGCGPRTSAPSAKAPIGAIQIDANVPQEHRDKFASALDYLDTLQTWRDNPDVRTTFGLDQISSSSLHGWLDERVHYLLPKGFSAPRRAFVAQSKYIYENPNIVPQAMPEENLYGDFQKLEVLMLNLGASIYGAGKSQQLLYGLQLARVGTVLIKSPRAGIIQIGPGLFKSTDPEVASAGYKIFLLGLLFHEGRHSDGHGPSVAFSHVECPKGHPYAGKPVCDSNRNGPYTIEYLLYETMIQNCDECSTNEIESLRGLISDARKRVLKTFEVNGVRKPTEFWDPRPEGQL